MSPIAANSTLEDADWDAQKSTIQRLYITEDRSLQALTEIMAASHGFCARYHFFRLPIRLTTTYSNSKAQYERHFKQWGLRKNLKSHEWKAIRHHTSKRKFNGKESDLYVDGILIPNKKVRKETSRNNFTSTFDRIAQGSQTSNLFEYIILTYSNISSPKPKNARRFHNLYTFGLRHRDASDEFSSLVPVCGFS